MKKNVDFISAKENISGKLGITRDVLLGATIITMEGNQILYIENYKGIITYTDKCIIILGQKNKIQIEGKNLQIAYYTNIDMKIQGCIICVKHF